MLMETNLRIDRSFSADDRCKSHSTGVSLQKALVLSFALILKVNKLLFCALRIAIILNVIAFELLRQKFSVTLVGGMLLIGFG